MIQKCDECEAPQCLFSRYAPGHDKGQKRSSLMLSKGILRQMVTSMETWFIYKNGDMANESEESKEREEPILFCREANMCGTAVEAQYYAPKDSQGRGKRIYAKRICCHCYTDRNLAKIKGVEEREERRGRPFHPICKNCLCNGVPVMYTKGGRKNG